MRGTLAVLVLVLAAVSVVVLVLSRGGSRQSADPAGVPAAERERDERGVAVDRTAAGATSERSLARAARSDGHGVGAASRAPERAKQREVEVRVEARFVDPEGAPIEGVRLAALDLGAENSSRVKTWGLDAHSFLAAEGPVEAPEVAGPDATSDAGGRAVLARAVRADALGEGGVLGLRASAPGRETAHLRAPVEDGRTSWLGDVVLPRGIAVGGRVLGPDGAPAAGALVVLVDPDDGFRQRDVALEGPHQAHVLAASEADRGGAFVFRGRPRGTARLWAAARDTLWSEASVPGDDDRLDVEIRLEPLDPARVLAGRVVADGGGAAGAVVVVRPEADRRSVARTVADASGAFRARIGDPGPLVVSARDAERRLHSAEVAGVPAGARDVFLELREPRAARVVVRDTAGEPVPWAWIDVLAEKGERKIFGEGYEGGRAGEAVLPVPEEPFRLRVFAPGFLTHEAGPFDPESVGDELRVAMARGAGVSGWVLHEGRAVVGARVALQTALAPERRSVSTAATRDDAPFAIESSGGLGGGSVTTTDERGAFTLVLRREGWVAVRAEREGLGSARSERFHVTAGALVEGIELELAEAGTLAGRVLVAPGVAPEGIRVGASRGDGVVHVATAGPDGRYRIDDLAPGPWQVRRVTEGDGARLVLSLGTEVEPALARELLPDVVVAAGRTASFDMDLRDEEQCRLSVRLVVQGLELVESWAVLQAPEEPRRALAFTHAEAGGRFELAVARPGPHVLAVRARSFELTREVVLAPGRNELDLEIATGEIEIATPPEEGDPLEPPDLDLTSASIEFRRRLYHRWSGEPGLVVLTPLWPSSEPGHAQRVPVPAGPAVIAEDRSTSLRDRAIGTGQWREHAAVEVEEGALLRVLVEPAESPRELLQLYR